MFTVNQSCMKNTDGVNQKSAYLNLPILLRCENISPPGTYSIIMYRLLLSCRETRQVVLTQRRERVEEIKTYGLLNAYLKRVLQSHQEGKADSLQDTFLVQCVFYLLQLHYLHG